MAYSARPTSTDLLTKLVHQTAHGFSVGTIVQYRLGTADYERCLADTLSHAGSPLMVILVVDANNFYVCQAGYVSALVLNAPYTTGTQYYLSATNPGELTTVVPSNLGQIVSPLFWADTATSGYFTTFPGIELAALPVLSDWLTVSANTSMIINTGYFVDNVANVDLMLPVSMTAGDTLQIVSVNTGGYTIKQNNLQTIQYNNDDTIPGTSGNIALDATLGVKSGSLEIICTVNDTNFKVIKSTGNFIVT
jgi:hypothetical protein